MNITPQTDEQEHAWVNGVAVKKTVNIDSTGNIFDGNQAQKVTTVGTVNYIAVAPPGTLQSEAKWQVKKVDETTGVVITWADGNANFDNQATDLTALTYS